MNRQQQRRTGIILATIMGLVATSVAVPLVWAAHSSTPTQPLGFGLRMDLFGTNANTKALLNAAQVMKSDWVAQDVKWKDIEPEAGRYNWSKLDGLLLALRPYGIRLMVSVSGTPDWARPAGSNLAYDGPPADYQNFARFLTAMASRYTGLIRAYEIWPEANLRSRWWTAEGVSPEAYVELLRQSETVLHTIDPMALVISGGLAPTGSNDGLNVVDDLTFYQRMYAAGLSQYTDGLGVRVDGYNNPPGDNVQSTSVSTTAYKGDSSFYFRHYEDVRAIMEANGAADQEIWLTSAGWASTNEVWPGLEYAADITEEQQAQYLTEALAQLQAQPYIAAVFIQNFNLSTSPNAPRELAPYSLIRSDWSARPAFIALAQIRQGDAFAEPAAAVTMAPVTHVLPNWHPRLRYTFESAGQ
jgi:hypothetical protein